MPKTKEKKVIWNSSSFLAIVAVYLVVLLFFGVYVFLWQGFGSHGLVFSIGGKNQVIDVFDGILLLGALVSFFLVFISLLAFQRRKDNRIFILAVAFFFFALGEVLQIFDNFFPQENLFIVNAGKAIDLIVLLSFAMLLYGRYKRK